MANDNLKKFMEVVSAEGDETIKKLTNADQETVISMAKERGITITPDDFVDDEDKAEDLSKDELASVAGGIITCFCQIGGGGPETSTHKICACAIGGGGPGKGNNPACICVWGGSY